MHELYKSNELEHLDPDNILYKMVVEGGLCVCNKCGKYGADLDKGCVQ